MKNYQPILHDYHIRKHGLEAALRMQESGWEDWTCPELMETGHALSAGTERVVEYGFFSMVERENVFRGPSEEDIKKAMMWMGCHCRPMDALSIPDQTLVAKIGVDRGPIIIAARKLGILVTRCRPHFPEANIFVSRDLSKFDSIDVMRDIIEK